MRPGDMLKLRWLRMIFIDDLRGAEYDLVIQYTNRYQQGETPVFTEEEIIALGELYKEARSQYLSPRRVRGGT